MSLYTEIYDFFNEARPRTKSAGIEDIKRGPVGQGTSKGDRPRPYTAKEKLKTLELPQTGPSKFEEGAVHEISFIPEKPKVVNPRKSPEEKKAKTDSQIYKSVQEGVYYTIYRKLTEAEYKKIKSSPYTNTIYPSNQPEHIKDLYYINFPLPLYGSRVHSATDLEVSIDLVPLSDIYEKGVGLRNLPPKELVKYVTEVPKVRFPFSLEDISFKYSSNLTREQAEDVEKYVASFKPNEKVEKIDRKKAKEILQTPEKMAAIAASGLFSYGGRLDGNDLLNRIVGSHNDVMKSSLQDTYDYYQPKRVDSQGNDRSAQTIELKETDPVIQSFLKDRKEKQLPALELNKEYPIENKKGYTITLTNNDKTKVREKRVTDITNFLSLVDEYIDTFAEDKEKNIVKKALIGDPDNLIKRRLGNDTLYNIIKARYDGKKSTVVPTSTKTEPEIKKDKVEPKTQKDKKEAPPKPETGKETVKDVKTEAEGFFKNSRHNETFRKLIEAFSATIERDEKGDFKFDKIQRQDQYNKLSKYVQELIEQIFKYTDQEPVRDYIVKNILNDRIDVLTGKDEKESIEIKTLINTNYEKMKKKPVQEMKISEAEGPSKKYAIELKADTPDYINQTNKLYISKNVPKVFGRKNTYIRSLSPDQVKSLNRSVDVVSVEEMPKDAKGFLKPSASFRDKEKGAVRFDPKNPKDIENLTGKLKPGDKLYSVNIKIGDAKGQDLMMPLSQIEKLVPDLKFGKNIQQPFEKEMFRTISKDTGEKIYDKVKGVLSFNSTEPIGKTDDKKTSEKPTSELPPAAKYSQKAGSQGNLTLKYYLVDVSDTENYPNGKMVRNDAGGYVGFNDREEAKKAADDMGPGVKVYQKAEVASKRVSFDDSPVAKKPEKAQYNYYLVSNGKVLKDKEGKYAGANSKEEAESLKDTLGFEEKDIKIVDKEQLKAMLVKKQTPGVPGNKFADYVKSWGGGINEALSKEDKETLEKMRVSFTIQDTVDVDKQLNISDNVREVKEEKGKLILVLAEAGEVTFDKEGTGRFLYAKDNEFYQTLNVPSQLTNIIKRALAPAKDTKEPESQLEAYIRKRIRQAIKEAEVSQYWGYQGKDVKKKRLEEYLKRYEWGFQDSENPYTHSNGSAIHAIVSKLVHELAAMGVDAIAIFNSYAPDGYQVSDINQLDYASDSPLGSQLTQPYNPDSLTARGGRVAEEDSSTSSSELKRQLDILRPLLQKGMEDSSTSSSELKRQLDILRPLLQKGMEDSSTSSITTHPSGLKRIAKEDGKVTSIAQQQLAKLDKLSIKQKAQAYLRGEFRVSQTATKKIEDDITAEYRKNPLGVDKDIKDAFMKMSDEDLKKNG